MKNEKLKMPYVRPIRKRTIKELEIASQRLNGGLRPAMTFRVKLMQLWVKRKKQKRQSML